MRRTKEEQEAADSFHKQKCCTTKWMACGILWLFIGLVLMIAAIAIYYAEDLEDYSGAQFVEDCYISIEVTTRCASETCTGSCTQNTYHISVDDDTTCAVGECPTFDNGCQILEHVGSCGNHPEYQNGEYIDCYAYSDASNCKTGNAGRLAPNNDWG